MRACTVGRAKSWRIASSKTSFHCRETDWLRGWLTDWLTGWLTGWLTDWLLELPPPPPPLLQEATNKTTPTQTTRVTTRVIDSIPCIDLPRPKLMNLTHISTIRITCCRTETPSPAG
ncbi:MAG TPA: hypothetical protein DDW55_09560 [Gammaproteobacteria bacterium]|nr:hypothetical protein [Gammaproteobacteria bacterium]